MKRVLSTGDIANALSNDNDNDNDNGVPFTQPKNARKKTRKAPSNASTQSGSQISSDKSKHIVLNEVLAYCGHYRLSCNRDAILRVAVSFFTSSEVAAAKKCLIGEFNENVTATPIMVDCRTTTSRSAHEAELEDIINTMEYLDSKNLLDSVSFAAVNLSRLPSHGPEETNICTIAEKQSHMSTAVDQLTSTVNELRSGCTRFSDGSKICSDVAACMKSVDNIDAYMRESLAAIHGKLDQIGEVSKQALDATASVPSRNSTHSSATDRSREYNVVVFAIPEDHSTRESGVWRSRLTEVLHTVAGRNVEVGDDFASVDMSQIKLGHLL